MFQALFKALGLNENDYKFGLTKVFFRPGKVMFLLEFMNINLCSSFGWKIPLKVTLFNTLLKVCPTYKKTWETLFKYCSFSMKKSYWYNWFHSLANAAIFLIRCSTSHLRLMLTTKKTKRKIFYSKIYLYLKSLSVILSAAAAMQRKEK